MAEDKPRLVRLTAILTQLQSSRIVTASTLAELHNVSIRTIYRDIRTLEKSGVPIVTEEGKGYSLVEGYKLPPVTFTEEEANALVTAEQFVLANKEKSLIKHYVSAATKVKAILNQPQQDKVELLAERLQIRTNNKQEHTSDLLITLQSAITNFKRVYIHYNSLKGEQSKRTVEPFALYTTKGNWILIAFCLNKQDFRAFRLDYIQQLTETTDKFEPHQITLTQYLENCRAKWQNTPDIPLT